MCYRFQTFKTFMTYKTNNVVYYLIKVLFLTNPETI